MQSVKILILFLFRDEDKITSPIRLFFKHEK